MMEVHKKFRLDGRSFKRDQLMDYCCRELEKSEGPVWRKEVLAFISLFLDSSRGDIIQKTSGTTGDPGTHILHRKSLILSASKTLNFFKLAPGSRVLHCLPMRFVAGKLMVVRALVGGLRLMLTEPSGRPVQDLREAMDFAAMVPLQVHESLAHGDPLGQIAMLLVGGGKLPYSSIKQLARLDRTAVYESFGMTETYTHFALKRINGAKPDRGFQVLEGVSISRDERNCLVVEVKGITSGPLSTNDLVEIDPSGTTFKWLGRYDYVINSGGIKIIPELLEQQIRMVINHNCLVLPEPDERLGSRLVLLVESPEETPPPAWMESLRAILPSYELPKRVLTCKQIPRNASMKMDRLAAKKMIADH